MYRKEFPTTWQVVVTGFSGIGSAIVLIIVFEIWRQNIKLQASVLTSETEPELEMTLPEPSRPLFMPF